MSSTASPSASALTPTCLIVEILMRKADKPDFDLSRLRTQIDAFLALNHTRVIHKNSVGEKFDDVHPALTLGDRASTIVELISKELLINGACKIGSSYLGQPEKAWTGDLRKLDAAWNGLCFGSPPEKLPVAVFSKKWPVGGAPGVMERHALTLHTALARRGHEIHVYTVPADGTTPGEKNLILGGLHVHFVQNNLGRLNCTAAWENLVTVGHVDVHSESLALPHYRSKELRNVAATWHGIGYEALYSELLIVIRNNYIHFKSATYMT